MPYYSKQDKYCQAQPQPKLNWAELALWSLFSIFLFILTNPHPEKYLEGLYCQAQPQSQFNWTELALKSLFLIFLFIFGQKFRGQNVAIYASFLGKSLGFQKLLFGKSLPLLCKMFTPAYKVQLYKFPLADSELLSLKLSNIKCLNGASQSSLKIVKLCNYKLWGEPIPCHFRSFLARATELYL